jgi:putative inorganic carbon (hco3(-)) transporter
LRNKSQYFPKSMRSSPYLSYKKQITILVTGWQWALLLLAAPFLLFPSVERSLALLTVPALWGMVWLANRKPLLSTPLNLSILLIMLMVLVSLYATFDIYISLPSIAGVVLGVGMYFAFVYSARVEKGLRIALPVFLACGLGMACLGVLGTHWIIKFKFLQPLLSHLPFLVQNLPGENSGFNSNVVAGALLWVLPLMMVGIVWVFTHLKWLANRLGWRRAIASILFFLAVTIFMSGVFSLAQSRSAIIGLAGSLLLILAILFPPKMRWIYLASLGILLAGFALVTLKLGWLQTLNEVNPGSSNSAFSLDSLTLRVDIWNRAIFGIRDFPFTGMGMKTFSKVLEALYPLYAINSGREIDHAHNEFLQTALDLGVPGLIAFSSLYLVSFWMLVEEWNWAKKLSKLSDSSSFSAILASSSGVKILVLGLGGGLIAHAIFGLTDAVIMVAKPGILFWMLLGLIAGLYLELRKLREQDTTI